MAFVTIPANAIEVGDPITKDLFDKVKDNFDDHETRILSQETSQKRIELINCIFGNAVSASTLTGLFDVNAPQDLTITECYVQIYEKGSLGGELEIDIKVNSTPNDTGMTSIFTTLPKITYASASDYDKSTNQVFNGAQTSVTEGHNIRLDVTELPTGGTIGKFRVVLYGEVS
jgi:hypothetical protein